MDVTIAPIPAEYDDYRAKLQSFIADHRPTLVGKQRSGVRVPDEADIVTIREYVAALHDAGYVLDRFTMEKTDRDEQRILEEELARAGIPFVLGNPLVSGAIQAFGTPDQQATYLPAMSRGDHIWTQLFSEPDAGSDLTSLKTKARLDGDAFVVDGQKVWSTWAQWSDYGYLLARTEDIPGPKGITAFILDMHTPGVECRPLREMTGTTDFNEVFLDGVRVPLENQIGERGQGWLVANTSLLSERSGVGGAGGGSDPMRALVDLASRHQRGGRPVLEDHGVRQDLGRLAARSRILRSLGHRAATKAARGTMEAWDAPLTKIWFSELNLDQAEMALRLLGPRSMLVEGDPGAEADGKWQDAFLYARAWTIAGGSNEIMRNLLAERGLGLPREPRGDR